MLVPFVQTLRQSCCPVFCHPDGLCLQEERDHITFACAIVSDYINVRHY